MFKIFFLDNQDSFTYNLVEELKQLNFDVEVFRNTVSSSHIFKLIQDCQQQGDNPVLFLSPGPGKPSDSPCMMELITLCEGNTPIVGICLGHQAIAEHFGAKVVVAGETVHGKASTIECCTHPVFTGLPQLLSVARYHSLIVSNLPTNLLQIASLNEMVMAIIDEPNKIVGFQFHPESILTTDGQRLLKQTIEYIAKPI